MCKHLEPKGDISNSLQSLCYCHSRDLTLGTRAFVCQVCKLYDPVKNTRRFSEVYEEGKKIAEKKIREKEIKLEAFEIKEITSEEELDFSLDEFEEEVEDEPTKFEKRKGGQAIAEDSDEFEVMCPFCDEVFGDLASHVQNCEFAPDDACISDILPNKKKKKKSKKTVEKTGKGVKTGGEKQKCPYCGKEFIRLGRHLASCSKRPDDKDKN